MYMKRSDQQGFHHDQIAKLFAENTVQGAGGTGVLLLVGGEVRYDGFAVAKRINAESVRIVTGSLTPGESRIRSRVRRALEAEGYTRVRSRKMDRYEFYRK